MESVELSANTCSNLVSLLSRMFLPSISSPWQVWAWLSQKFGALVKVVKWSTRDELWGKKAQLAGPLMGWESFS